MLISNNTRLASAFMQYSSGDNVDAITTRANQLSIINEFASSLIRIVDLDELYDYVTHQVVKRLGFDECSIFIADLEKQILNQVSSIHNTMILKTNSSQFRFQKVFAAMCLKPAAPKLLATYHKTSVT